MLIEYLGLIHPYKLALVKKLSPIDKRHRLEFFRPDNLLVVKPNIAYCLFMSDKVIFFYKNGLHKKQHFRYWATENQC